MAEDKSQKTEKPTPKHKRDARKDGRVARSAEIGSWFSLGVVVLALPALGKHAVSEVSGFMSLATNTMAKNDPSQSVSLFWDAASGRSSRPSDRSFSPQQAAAAFAAYGQVGLHFSPGALGFKWNKISPATGIKTDLLGPGSMGDHEDVLPPDNSRRDRLRARPAPHPQLARAGHLAHTGDDQHDRQAASSVSSATSRVPRSCWRSPTTPSSAASSTTR